MSDLPFESSEDLLASLLQGMNLDGPEQPDWLSTATTIHETEWQALEAELIAESDLQGEAEIDLEPGELPDWLRPLAPSDLER